MNPWSTSPVAMENLEVAYDHAIRRYLSPPPVLTGADWANTFHILPSENAAEPGPYRWQRAPYQREMLNVCVDDEHQKVVLMMAARTGKTLCLLNTLGFYAHQEPSPIMVLGPTNGYVQGFSKNSIEPLFFYSRDLKPLLSWDVKDKNNTITEKKFAGGSIYLTGAESPSGLRGRTIRVLLADEIDAMPESSGDEGDPIALAEVRTTTYQHRAKVILASTPLIKDLSLIEREFEQSDQRHYLVPCPECGHKQKLKWDHLIYTGVDSPVYECQNYECGYNIPESKKPWMLEHGEWVAQNPDSPIAGFHISALYSPFQSWSSLVTEWKGCKNNPHLLQRFLNTRLGQTWDSSGTRTHTNDLMKRLEEYPAQIPEGVGVLTCGVDVQKSPGRIEASVWGYGADNEMWLIDHRVIEGDTDRDEVWNHLQAFLTRQTYALPNGVKLRMKSVAIDSGFLADRVYRFVEHMNRVQANTKVFAIKGRDSYRSIVDEIPRQSKKYRQSFRMVGTDMAKDLLVGLLSNAEKGPNYVHLPVILPVPPGTQLAPGEQRWLSSDLLDQLTSEKPKLQVRNGKRSRSWVLPPGKRNEALDCWVYSYAALRVLGLPFFNSLGERAEKLLEEPVSAPSTEVDPDSSTPYQTPSAPPTVRKRKGLKVHAPSMNQTVFRY